MTSRNEIPSRTCEITQAVEMGQMLMFDMAYRKHGFSRKILHLETGIPLTTIKSYEEGTAMPVAAFTKIAAVRNFPNELLSLVLDPSGKTIADAEPEETDLDDTARAAVDFLARYVGARHPESPGNIRIVHNEIDDLKMSARGLRDRAGKAAA
jgi:hypothetical protein